MRDTPKISVVMPCFNCEKYVSQAITSILSQTFEDFELIVVDDGSDDGSKSEIYRHLHDKRLKYYAMESNMGNYHARNFGMMMVTSKYLAVMDADDIADVNRLQTEYDFLERNRSIGGVGSQGYWMNENDNVFADLNKPFKTGQLKLLLLKNNYTLHPSLMFRNALLKKNALYYDETLRYSADYDFVVRCSRYFKIENIPDRLIKYRMHVAQISSSKRQEQMDCANDVRLRQLRQFGISISDEEVYLYQQLMRDDDLMITEFDVLLELINRITEINRKLKLYPGGHLFDFFQVLLSKAYGKAAAAIDK